MSSLEAVWATAVANTTQFETHPRLAGDLLVWQRQNSGSGYDLYASPLDANGLPNGETFVIQETAVSQLDMISNQQNTAVHSISNGRVHPPTSQTSLVQHQANQSG